MLLASAGKSLVRVGVHALIGAWLHQYAAICACAALRFGTTPYGSARLSRLLSAVGISATLNA